MPRSTATKVYRNFVAGLQTESSLLTYPENASFDEDNCILFRKGNRTRRLGLEYETSHVLNNVQLEDRDTARETFSISQFSWFNVNKDANINFLVQQVGNFVYFYDINGAATSANRKPFIINLNLYRAPQQTEPFRDEVSFASGRGFLFITSKRIEPLVIEYDVDEDTILVDKVEIIIRDFDGLEDGLANDEEPTTLTSKHKYNLQNQGWIDPSNDGTSGTTVDHFHTTTSSFRPLITFESSDSENNTYTASGSNVINQYFQSTGRYPGNNKQWWLGKLEADDPDTGLEAGDFDPDLLEKVYFGNVRAPRGHYLLPAFNKDRSAISGVSGLSPEVTINRPEAIAFYAGRVWYAEGSDVYFSQVLSSKEFAGRCYQNADPTAEAISDLLENDGGVIPIPEARNIKKMVPFGSGVLIFADNGVWLVSGTSRGFVATEYSVSKVTTTGLDGNNTVVEAEGAIFWWSKTGIQAIQQNSGAFGPIDGSFSVENISKERINEFFFDIDNRRNAKGIFDPAANLIQWFYASNDNNAKGLYNRVLNFDLSLQAFYPWSISKDPNAEGPYLTGAFITPEVNIIDGTSNVLTSDGNQVVASGNLVVANDPQITTRNQSVKYILAVPTTFGNTNLYAMTHGEFKNPNCADWETYEGSQGYAYNSFVETGFELFDDVMRDKQLDYVFLYFKQSEQNFVANGDDFDADFNTSCKFQVRWDWANSSRSNRWSREIEGYRLGRVQFTDDTNLTFDTGFPIVITKNKVRGHGRAIQFRFSNNKIGSNFDLLGWAAAVSGVTNP